MQRRDIARVAGVTFSWQLLATIGNQWHKLKTTIETKKPAFQLRKRGF
jgi:hypothetical protein